jgi:hypothetical protein
MILFPDLSQRTKLSLRFTRYNSVPATIDPVVIPYWRGPGSSTAKRTINR